MLRDFIIIIIIKVSPFRFMDSLLNLYNIIFKFRSNKMVMAL